MLEDNVLTDDALIEMEKIIHDKNLQKEIAEHNYKMGKKYFSFTILQNKLEELFKF